MDEVVPCLQDDAALHSRQLERESEMVRLGVERYCKTELEYAKAGEHGRTQAGRGVLSEIMKALIPAVEKLQEEALQELVSDGQDHFKRVTLRSIDAQRIAFITARAVFSFRSIRDDEPDPLHQASAIAGFEPVLFLAVAMDVGRQVIQERRSDVRRDERWQEHLLQDARDEIGGGERLLAMEKLESVVDVGGHVLPKKEKRFIHAKGANAQIKNLLKQGVPRDPERQRRKPNTIDVTSLIEETLNKSKSSLTRKEKTERLNDIRKAESSLHQLDLRSLGKSDSSFTMQQLVSVGGELVELLIQTFPDCFELIDLPETPKPGQSHSPKKANYVALKPAVVEWLKDEHARRELERPWRMPMVYKPVAWAFDDTISNYVGGYLRVELPLISHQQRRRHTTDLGNPIGANALSAINAIQSTPWRINRRVLEVMKVLLAHPEGISLDLPIQLSDEKKKWKHKRRSIQRTLDAATELCKETAIWFPHYMDFRGRIYPYSQDLHPQLGDAPRALLEFEQGKLLGPHGREYLASQIASLHSKNAGVFRAEQVAWVEKHTDQIRSLVQDPLKEIEFWKGAGDPWRFLAACIEWDQLHEQGEDKFKSHLPILMDGTCNGLQHLAALTGDPQLAQSVNLTSGDRGDIYMDVANAVTEWLKAEVDPQRKKLAEAWLQLGVTRKTMKPCVLPIPYGVSQKGIKDVLIKEHKKVLPAASLKDAANYLAGGVWRQMEGRAGPALEVMKWLKKLAKKLAKVEKPLIWTTPAGSRVRMANFKTVSKIVRLRAKSRGGRCREIRVREETPNLDAAKQGKGAAPNFVHSLDAAHLIKTVNACVGAGMGHFMMIHDAYGVHACDASDLARILREQFVDMYQHDWLDRLWHESLERYPDLKDKKFKGPPARAAFDISQVLKSQFFFH